MLPPSTILVPLDGSSFAEEALPLAKDLALSSGATLCLAMVHTTSASWDPGVEFSLLDPELEQQVREREVRYLEERTRHLGKSDGLQVEHVLLNGGIAPALEAHVEETGIDLIVMTSHGRGGIGRVLVGNVADQLIHRLNVPVLVIRPRKVRGEQPAQRRRILVPLDGSVLAESILEQAKAFARLTQAELLLVTVVQPIPVLLPPFVWQPERLEITPEHREFAARNYLEAVKRRLRMEGFTVQSRVRLARKVAPEILNVAKESECSSIAIATHGASGLDRLMLGSVADQVVRHTEIPVLLLRPQSAEREGTVLDAAEEFAAW